MDDEISSRGRPYYVIHFLRFFDPFLPLVTHFTESIRFFVVYWTNKILYYLVSSRTPVHKINLLALLNTCYSSIDIFRYNVSSMKKGGKLIEVHNNRYNIYLFRVWSVPIFKRHLIFRKCLLIGCLLTYKANK